MFVTKAVGTERIQEDGYVIDFGDIKKAARTICKELNEYFICPMKSTDLSIVEIDGQICISCEDGTKFSFPKGDCALLPLVHSSAEELSHYLWCRLVRFVAFQFPINLNAYKLVHFLQKNRL